MALFWLILPKGLSQHHSLGQCSWPAVSLLQFLPEGNHAESDQGSPAVEAGKRANTKRAGETGRGTHDPDQPHRRETRLRPWPGKAQDHVSKCPETDCRSATRALGEMEGCTPAQIGNLTKPNDPPNICQRQAECDSL